MMTDRERLIELIRQEVVPYFAERIADHLLANGVTFATDTNDGDKWSPASEPPEVWRDKKGTLVNYLVYMPEYGVDVGNYMKPAKNWLCLGIPCKVTHWMPLPEPPKEA